MKAIRWCWGLSALVLLARTAWGLRAFPAAVVVAAAAAALVGRWLLARPSRVPAWRAGAGACAALGAILLVLEIAPGGWLTFLLIWASALGGAVLVALLLRPAALAILTAPFGFFLALSSIGSLWNGYTEWFTLLPARIEVDGKPAGGYVHIDRTSQGSVAIVTVRGVSNESYRRRESTLLRFRTESPPA